MMIGLDLLFGDEVNFGKRIISGLFFGIIMSLLGYYSHFNRLKWMEVFPVTLKDLKVHQSRVISSQLSPEAIKAKIEISPYFTKAKIETVENQLRLNLKSSLSTLGEIITINMESEREGQYEYQVSSRPRMKTNIMDAGKNLENIFVIERILKSA